MTDETPDQKAVKAAMKNLELMRDRAMMALGDATEFIVLARQKNGKVVAASAYLDPAPWVCVIENQKLELLAYYRARPGSERIIPGDGAEN